MANVTCVSTDNSEIRISIEGRIDSVNASEVETSINEIVSGQEVSRVIFDCKALKYISSAGLRIFLRLKKDCQDIRIVEVSHEVYDIFEMTGFTEILNVERAYRSISLKGCELIGEGSNGKVYRYDRETIVKVFKKDDLDSIIKERDISKRALILGIPTAIPYDIVKVDGHYASAFELIDAKSFSEIIKENPDSLSDCIDMSVSLLRNIHGLELHQKEFPDYKGYLLSCLKDVEEALPDSVVVKARGLIEAIPESNHVVHGDFHTKNLMFQNDEVIIIDMDTLSLGNPVFEFAQQFFAYTGLGEVDRSLVEGFFGIDWELCQRYREETLRRYLGFSDGREFREAEMKTMVLGYIKALRFALKKCDGHEAIISHYVSRLQDLVPQVESLAF